MLLAPVSSSLVAVYFDYIAYIAMNSPPLHDAHIPIESILPGRRPKTISSQPEFNSCDELSPGEVTFLSEDLQQDSTPSCREISLDCICNQEIFCLRKKAKLGHSQANYT